MFIRTYTELITFPTFKERYEYLRLDGTVGEATFGFDRVFNQDFYHRSPEWKSARRKVILRDFGRDLGIEGYEINGVIVVHHMNPISVADIQNNTDILLNPEFLITTTLGTHNAIHYGDESLLIIPTTPRSMNDTCPWKH